MPAKAAAAPSSGSELTPRGGVRTGGKEQGDFVSVAVRVKPAGSDESIAVWAKPSEGEDYCRSVCRHRGYFLEEYEFSRVFRPEDDNHGLFQGLHGPAIADSVFSGVSETVFAYGQTGSGKTHTIFGTANEPGILTFFVREVFDRAATCLGSTIHVCCYEVLGDSLTDLIKPEGLLQQGALKQEDVVCDELFLKTQKFRYKIVQVHTKATCMTLLQDARMNRTAGVSSANPHSSRSHAIVHIFVQNPALDGGGGRAGGLSSSSIGALTLVDLAGAEKEHENPSEQGRKSARILNTSLSSLNRLLRKLQTNTLDESERRQSVLNKCLWEYLRPGCGIALIFCVSPLFKHRATSFTTLSMATASKLIQSRRKCQYIQVPAGALQEAYDEQAAAAAASPSAASPRGADRRPSAATPRRHGAASPSAASPRGVDRRPSAATPRARATSADATRNRGRTPESTPQRASTPARASCVPRSSTPRHVSNTTPARPHTANAASAGGRPSCTGSTPGPHVAASSPFFLPPAGVEDGRNAADCGTVFQLELQNKKLRRRLSKTRMQSSERLSNVERERDQRNAENAMLRQECESLRSLFIKQQQQQIAFWAGPFMDVILPKSNLQPSVDNFVKKEKAPVAAVLAAASPAKATSRSTAPVPMAAETQDKSPLALPKEMVSSSRFYSLDTLEAKALDSGKSVPAAFMDVKGEADPSDCVRSLLEDRDYWQDMANQITRQSRRSGPPVVHLSLEKGTINTQGLSRLSSPSSPSFHLSDGNVEIALTSDDSGTESTRSTAEN